MIDQDSAARVLDAATDLLTQARDAGCWLATAESCTGGLIGGALTAIPGSSDVVDRGFITYSNEAKTALLGVDPSLIEKFGAVSEPVAREMAKGAAERAQTPSLALAVTGVAGPGGGTAEKPEGRVHIAAWRVDADGGFLRAAHIVRDYGPLGRAEVRAETVFDALALGIEMFGDPTKITRG